jgi:hypothetical protein
MGFLENPHLFPTIFLISCTFLNHLWHYKYKWVFLPWNSYRFITLNHWLLSPYTKYTPYSLPKFNKHVLLTDAIVK